MENITVADVMSKDLVCVEGNASIRDAAKVLTKKGISSLAVKVSGKVVGIVTERDFVKSAAMDRPPGNVGEMMSKELITIRPSEHVLEAVRLMGKHRIRHLVVNDGKEAIAIVSLRDVLKVEPDAIYGYISQKGES